MHTITIEEPYLKMFLKEKDLNPTRVFDKNSMYFSLYSPAGNAEFLQDTERYFTARLQDQGFLFLNDVCHIMDLPMTKAGQITGWLYDPEEEDGSNRVSFGISDETYELLETGKIDSVTLEFNIDGEILSKVVFPDSGDEY